MVKDTEIAAFEADNADLSKMAVEAAEPRRRRPRGRGRPSTSCGKARRGRLGSPSGRGRRRRPGRRWRPRRNVRLQSEQWRKAAKEAAAVLGGGADPAPRASSSTDKRRLGRRRRERGHGSQGWQRAKGSREQRHRASTIFGLQLACLFACSRSCPRVRVAC